MPLKRGCWRGYGEQVISETAEDAQAAYMDNPSILEAGATIDL